MLTSIEKFHLFLCITLSICAKLVTTIDVDANSSASPIKSPDNCVPEFYDFDGNTTVEYILSCDISTPFVFAPNGFIADNCVTEFLRFDGNTTVEYFLSCDISTPFVFAPNRIIESPQSCCNSTKDTEETWAMWLSSLGSARQGLFAMLSFFLFSCVQYFWHTRPLKDELKELSSQVTEQKTTIQGQSDTIDDQKTRLDGIDTQKISAADCSEQINRAKRDMGQDFSQQYCKIEEVPLLLSKASNELCHQYGLDLKNAMLAQEAAEIFPPGNAGLGA